MLCERPGAFRANLDGELDPVRRRVLERHLPECPRCQAQLEAVRANALIVARRLEVLVPSAGFPISAESAEAPVPAVPQLAFRRQLQGVIIMLIRSLAPWQRATAAAALTVLLLAALVTLPAGRALAIDFLNLFRVQRFAVVTVDPRQPFDPLAHLERLGTVHVPSRVEETTVGSLDAATAQAGIPVRHPSVLPAGFATTPRITLLPASEATFTIDRQKAERYLQSVGANRSVPPHLDGARLVLRVPAAVLLTYEGRGQPPLVVAQLASPTVTVEGRVSLAEVREFLLGVPGLPEDTRAQLRAMNDWMITLPVPVPRDRAAWREIMLNGVPALIIADNTALAGGLIWQRDGIVTAIAGPLSERQLLDVAQSLR